MIFIIKGFRTIVFIVISCSSRGVGKYDKISKKKYIRAQDDDITAKT